jgi:hypothetical protein
MTTEFVNAAQQLADLLERENDALKRMDFPSAVLLVPAKETALAALIKQPKLPAIQPLATTLMQHVNAVAAENQMLLERALAVQTRIIRIVARAAARPAETAHYNEHGARPQPYRAAALAVSTRV